MYNDGVNLGIWRWIRWDKQFLGLQTLVKQTWNFLMIARIINRLATIPPLTTKFFVHPQSVYHFVKYTSILNLYPFYRPNLILSFYPLPITGHDYYECNIRQKQYYLKDIKGKKITNCTIEFNFNNSDQIP